MTSSIYKYITKCCIIPQFNNPDITTKETKQLFTCLSILHKLELCFMPIYHYNLQILKRCIPFPILPWHKPPSVHISTNAELAISNHNSLMKSGNYLAIYTNGIRINGRINAFTAIMFSPWPKTCPLVVQDKCVCIRSN